MSFKFTFTQSQLQEVIGPNPRINEWFEAIVDICPDYKIDTPIRLAAFLAQCAHESANFKRIEENLNYSANALMQTWPSRFKTIDIASQYARNPQKIANRVYANRLGNRDEASGDGWMYRGRGLIQLTGKENYQRFASSIKKDVSEMPEYLSTIRGAVQSACFFWETNKLNGLADKQDIVALTKKINGGTIGLEERQKLFTIAKKVLGV